MPPHQTNIFWIIKYKISTVEKWKSLCWHIWKTLTYLLDLTLCVSTSGKVNTFKATRGRQTVFDYLLIRSKLWTIDPLNCDTVRDRKPSVTITLRMIEDFLQLQVLHHKKHLLKSGEKTDYDHFFKSLPPVMGLHATAASGTRSKWTNLCCDLSLPWSRE